MSHWSARPQTPLNRHGLLSLFLLVPPKLDLKALLLKTQHVSVVGHKEIKLELSRELSCWLVFLALEGDNIKADRGEKASVDLPRYRT